MMNAFLQVYTWKWEFKATTQVAVYTEPNLHTAGAVSWLDKSWWMEYWISTCQSHYRPYTLSLPLIDIIRPYKSAVWIQQKEKTLLLVAYGKEQTRDSEIAIHAPRMEAQEA